MNYYKIVLSKGVPLILDERKTDEIIDYPGPSSLIKIWNEDKTKFDVINKAHIVQIYFDHQDDKQEYELVDGVYKLRKDIKKA